MTANSMNGLNQNAIQTLINQCRSNLDVLAARYDKAIEGSPEVSAIAKEYQVKADRLSQEYGRRIEVMQQGLPQLADIKREVIRQVKAIEGFLDMLSILGMPSDDLVVELPEQFSGWITTEVPVSAPLAPVLGREAPMSAPSSNEYRPYRTIVQSIMEMFSEKGNNPMRPKEIVAYLLDEKLVDQAEGSIRTQLHNLKKVGTLNYNAVDHTYNWASKTDLKKLARV